MSDNYQWRRRFIDLVEDVFRDLGFPPPAMTHEPSEPLSMEIEVDEVSFEVVHVPDQRPQHILIECNFGLPPPGQVVPVLTRLLQVNLIMAREHQATFGADSRTGAVIFTSSESLAETNARALMDEMRALAKRAKEWRRSYYLEDDSVDNGVSLFETLA
ncbi:CesT family type III secretion system chaperone [Lacisediminimonas sp.]|uniref:CesT family type III secretion system chaperone n=1 Tax=Lacisediminimonas sp. TaxID=3060582 RepID=UPI00272063A2|nr:CesT family type III secretion system chaperone [Lacisediminimonas sp.]MDO8301082.1 CesT family type III secretion system chaperone [Lacisediminimonas sp.]